MINDQTLEEHPPPKDRPNPLVYLDLSVAGDPVGRLVIRLYANVVPKTAENFRLLCVGGQRGPEGNLLSYRGSVFHRIINRFMLQGGDFTAGDGSGGWAAAPDSRNGNFADENFLLRHERAGLLSMANAGPDTNGSQFFVTTVNCPHLDGKHVVFGEVVRGMGIVREIEVMPTGEADRPLKEVKVEACGELPHTASFQEETGICESDGTQDVYPFHPEDLDLDWYLVANFNPILSIVKDIKASGNHFFLRNEWPTASRKYAKALKYISLLRESMGSTDEEQEKAIRALEIPCCLNVAAVALKRGQHELAIKECDKVLEVDAKNAKALFRRGQARRSLKDHELALKDLISASSLSMGDRAVLAELNALRGDIKAYRVQEKSIYSKMFA